MESKVVKGKGKIKPVERKKQSFKDINRER
jgi:hypothetical protein